MIRLFEQASSAGCSSASSSGVRRASSTINGARFEHWPADNSSKFPVSRWQVRGLLVWPLLSTA